MLVAVVLLGAIAYEAHKTNSQSRYVMATSPWELFDTQSEKYKSKVLGSDSAFKVSIEAGTTFGWEKYTGRNGLNIGIDHFGESAPGSNLSECFGFTPEKVANQIKKAFS